MQILWLSADTESENDTTCGKAAGSSGLNYRVKHV